MATDVKLSIALPPELAADIHKAVASGECVSISEVICDALRAWKQLRQAREVTTAELRRLWREGVDSGGGEILDAEAIKHRGLERLAAR